MITNDKNRNYELNDFIPHESSNEDGDIDIDNNIFNNIMNGIRDLKKLAPLSTYHIKNMSRTQKIKIILEYDKVLQIVLQVLDGTK